MSQWTHVCGCIRVDWIESLSGSPVKMLREHFGQTCNYDSPDEDWNACNVPCGSEGSLQYTIQRTGGENSLAWGLVYLWGDLRDYGTDGTRGTPDDIFAWLVKTIDGLYLRGCAVKVDVEFGDSYLICDSVDRKLDMIKLVAVA